MPGYTVGMLAQEPPLNEAKTVLGNIEEAVAETKAKLARFNEIAEQMATDYSDELMEEMGKLQEELDHADAWDIDSQLEQAMDALRCPPPDADVTQLSGGERRRVALCKLLLEAARPAAARRAHQPPGRRERAVAGAAPGQVPRHGHRDHPRPVLPGQRGAVDPRARPRPGLPVRGQLLHLPGEEGRSGSRSQGRKDAKLQKRLDRRAGVGALQRQGPPDQVQGPARPLRGDGHRGGEDPQARLRGDPDPAGPAPGQHGHRGQRPGQGLRRPGADRRPVVLAAAQRHRRHHRPERRRQDHAVQDHRRAGEAGRRRGPGRRDGQAVVRRPEPLRPRPATRRSGRSSPTGSTT